MSCKLPVLPFEEESPPDCVNWVAAQLIKLYLTDDAKPLDVVVTMRVIHNI